MSGTTLDVAAIAAGIAAAAGTATNVRSFDTVPDQIPTGVAAAAVVLPGDPFIDYHDAMQGYLTTMRWEVLLVAQSTSTRSAQQTLYALVSGGTGQDRSIVDALEADETFGGTVHTSVVEGAEAFQPREINGVGYLTTVVQLRCNAGRN